MVDVDRLEILAGFAKVEISRKMLPAIDTSINAMRSILLMHKNHHLALDGHLMQLFVLVYESGSVSRTAERVHGELVVCQRDQVLKGNCGYGAPKAAKLPSASDSIMIYAGLLDRW